MATTSTLLIMFLIAYANAYASFVGVKFKLRQKKRLWQNDQGVYMPLHLTLPGFYRGLFINVGFAATSLCVATFLLAGQSGYSEREPLFLLGAINLILSFITACCVSASFEEELECCTGKFWRVVGAGIVVGGLYVFTGIVLVNYVNDLKVIP